MSQPGDLTSFGRYSREAMRVMFAARAKLARLGGDALLPEHVLLALLEPEAGSAWEVLQRLGVSVDAIRTQVESVVPRSNAVVDPSDLPLGPGMIAVLEHAHASEQQIGSRDLLASVLGEGTSGAAAVLRDAGLTVEAIRSA